MRLPRLILLYLRFVKRSPLIGHASFLKPMGTRAMLVLLARRFPGLPTSPTEEAPCTLGAACPEAAIRQVASGTASHPVAGHLDDASNSILQQFGPHYLATGSSPTRAFRPIAGNCRDPLPGPVQRRICVIFHSRFMVYL